MPDFIPTDIAVDFSGKSNAAGLQSKFYYAPMDDIALIPAVDTNENKLTGAITMRAAQAAVPATANTPAIAARPAGKFVKVTVSEVDGDIEVNALGEADNHGGYEAIANYFANGHSARVSRQWMDLRNRPVGIIYFDIGGAMRFLANITLKATPQYKGKKGYKIHGKITVMENEPPYIDTLPQ